MTKWMRVAVVAGLAAAVMAVGGTQAAGAVSSAGGVSVEVQQTGTQLAYVVFHAVDRDGFCDAAAFGAVSLHPVLTDAPNDTMINGATGLPNPRATLDVYIDSGDGVILDTSDRPAAGARSVSGLHTFSTYDNANSATPIKAFPPLDPNAVDECQAWVEVVSSLGQAGNVLMIFHDDTGDIGFDKIVNGPAATSPATSSDTTQASMMLSPGWSLVTWSGGDGVAPGAALNSAQSMAGGGAVTALYTWDAATVGWLAYFPGADGLPGANTLTALKTGQAYWVAVSGGAVAWP